MVTKLCKRAGPEARLLSNTIAELERAEAERDALKQANADLLQAANRRIAVQRAERVEAELKKAEGYLWEILYCPMPKTSSKSYVMRIPKELLSTINAFARRNKEGQ